MVRNMPNCSKCGAKITEAMSFCPNCGTSLKVVPPPAAAPAPTPAPPPQPMREEKQEKREKGEKREKEEKGEKGEKHEKRAYGPIGPLIGGVILIMIGLLFYVTTYLNVPTEMAWAYFFVIIGTVVILATIYAAMTAARRHPPT